MCQVEDALQVDILGIDIGVCLQPFKHLNLITAYV